MAVSSLRWNAATCIELPAAVNGQRLGYRHPQKTDQSSLEEGFALTGILQYPQESRTVRIPIESGPVALTLPFREVAFGIGQIPIEACSDSWPKL